MIYNIHKFANERLSKKQKRILICLVKSPRLTASKLAEQLTTVLNCSKSCIWENIRALSRAGLIVYGNGKFVYLTSIGKLIAKNLGGDVNER